MGVKDIAPRQQQLTGICEPCEFMMA